MDDDVVVREFGGVLFDVLRRHQFREVGRFADEDGWFTRTYLNGDLGVHLISHMGTEVDLTPASQVDFRYNLGLISEFFGDALRDNCSNDEKARYIDQNYDRLTDLFGERDGGIGLRGLRTFLKEKNLREYGI